MEQYHEAKKRLKENPSKIRSHTVFIVDKSASMKQSDMNGHKTRFRGVYFAMAEDYVAPQLAPPSTGILGGPSCSYEDVVTVIEMRNDATVVIDQEPVSWILYNRLVAQSKVQDARFHGVYNKSLEKAHQILRLCPANCAPLLVFLSDGKPSDATCAPKGRGGDAVASIYRTMTEISCTLGPRLIFVAHGFGNKFTNFEVLQEMVSVSKAANL